MRVLQLCPLWHPISRNAPGGIETLLAHLSVFLRARGCKLTNLASGESVLAGELVPVTSQSVVSLMAQGSANVYDYFEQHQLHLAALHAGSADVIHSHIGSGGLVLTVLGGRSGAPTLHTLHSPITDDLLWFASRHPEIRFSVVSDFQRARLRSAASNFCAVVPNGVNTASFGFRDHGTGRLFFMGRMERNKGPVLAIKTAIALGMPLDLAGPIVEEAYFHDEIEPMCGETIRYLGILDHEGKVRRLQAADCVLMPSRCDEAFGLVAVEAMACGTPVVATRRGALPEIVEDGVTGFLVANETELVPAVREAMSLPRRPIRQRAIERFDLARVAERYHALYERLAREHGVGRAHRLRVG